jgi:chromosome segregation ATPase
MLPTPALPQDNACAAHGELIVQNGRLSGARRPLNPVLTLLGQAPGCDVRLNVEGVSPQHCALVHGPSGLLLRDLSGDGSTLVNGEPADTRALGDGDVLHVGPFQFQVRLPQPHTDTTAPDPEALRIQAAAVAAQQAALTEEEAKLLQRRQALQRQEEQLSAHLEEKRSRLLELQRQVQQARADLRAKREELDQQGRELAADVARARKKEADEQKQVQAERARLKELRRRLKKRWHRHWDVREADMQRREHDLAGQRRALEKDTEQIQQERAILGRDRLRCNGEIELSRRQLRAAWDELYLAQRQTREEQGRQREKLDQQILALEQREQALAEAEQELAQQRERWEGRRPALEKEIEGLENRIRNYRRKLPECELEAARREDRGPGIEDRGSSPEVHSFDPRSSILDPHLAPLEQLADELADQRLCLAEQAEHLLEAQERWQQERDAVAAELEATGRSLHERQQELEVRERMQEAVEFSWRQRDQELTQARQQLEGRQARSTARAAAWESDRDTQLAQLQSREDLVKRYLTVLADLRQRWTERRREELERWRTEIDRCHEVRQAYAALWDEYRQRNAALEEQQRTLAERALAMEQYRLELIGQADNSVAAEKKLERLRRRWTALSAVARRRVAAERRAVEAEAARLTERARQLHEQAAQLAAREGELSAQQTEWQQEQAQAKEAQDRQRQELFSLRAQRDHYERLLRELRDEVERMAQVLLADNDPPELPAAQAA